MFDTSEINEVKSRWAEIYPRARKGIICPICGNGSGEDGDGVILNPRGGNYVLKCFKCGFSGSVIDLIMQEQKLSFPDAVRRGQEALHITPGERPFSVANRAFKEKSGLIPVEGKKAENKPQTPPVIDYSGYFAECMERFTSPEAVSYMKSRGITPERAGIYCGYDPAWVSPEALRKGSRPYPSKMIIFFCSPGPEGKLNSYVARRIDGKKEYSKMNERGNGEMGFLNYDAIFSKRVFITEGPFDALAIREAGPNALSLNSTSNAGKLISLLKAPGAPNKDEIAKYVYLCLDKDEAGNRATEELERGFREIGVNAMDVRERVIFAGKDANEALIADRERFIGAVNGVIMDEREKPGILSGFLEEVQGEAYKPLETGEEWFDDLLGGGVIRQTLLILMAAPGAGKTTLCQQIAEDMAKSGRKVKYLSLEMSSQQMYAKAISRRLALKNGTAPGKGFCTMDILQGYKWTDTERAMILEEARLYEKEILCNLEYVPEVEPDIENVKGYLSQVGDAARKNGEEAPVIVLDYLHLLTGNGIDVQELIKRAVKALKDYAIQYNTFCMAISASNRDSNKSNKINMNSGRDSSGIEYSADYLLGIEKEEEMTTATNQGDYSKVRLKVIKSRFSKTDENGLLLNFDKRSNYFWKGNETKKEGLSGSRKRWEEI